MPCSESATIPLSSSSNRGNWRQTFIPTTYADVDIYIDLLDASRQSSLQRLRRIILETVPGAEETIQYNVPYYTYHGMLCAFASQKHYMSFYFLNGEIVEKNRHLLAGLSVGKGCTRFKDINKLPEPTIRAMLREAAKTNEAQPNDHC